MLRRSIYLLVILSLAGISFAACSQPAPAAVYDPAKQYAGYLVAKSPQATPALNSAKQKSAAEGLETGPVVYYEPGTKDFEEHFKKLTPSKQILVIWVIGSLLDSPNIQKAISATGYKGQVRYEPVTGAAQQTSQ